MRSHKAAITAPITANRPPPTFTPIFPAFFVALALAPVLDGLLPAKDVVAALPLLVAVLIPLLAADFALAVLPVVELTRADVVPVAVEASMELALEPKEVAEDVAAEETVLGESMANWPE